MMIKLEGVDAIFIYPAPEFYSSEKTPDNGLLRDALGDRFGTMIEKIPPLWLDCLAF